MVVGTGPDADVATALLERRGARVSRVASEQEALRTPVPDVMVVDEWTAEVADHVRRARASGVDVIVPAQLILEDLDLPVVAVTGSGGKTGTSHLVASILRAAGRRVAMASARLANAWPDHSLLDGRADDAEIVVAELTSTHLCFMRSWRGPMVGVLTAFWSDHIEFHGSLAAYESAKVGMLDRAGRVVAGADSALRRRSGSAWVVDAEFSILHPVHRGAWIDAGRLWIASGTGDPSPVMRVDDAPDGTHPGSLIAGAATAVALGVDGPAVARGVRACPAPPHRMNRVGEWHGRVLIDDSCCATPRKVIEALRRCPPGRTVLVAGGRRRVGGRMVHRSLEEASAEHEALRMIDATVRAVVPFGDAAGRFAGCRHAVGAQPDLGNAIARARDLSEDGDTILVSPMYPVTADERARVPRLLRDPDAPASPHGDGS